MLVLQARVETTHPSTKAPRPPLRYERRTHHTHRRQCGQQSLFAQMLVIGMKRAHHSRRIHGALNTCHPPRPSAGVGSTCQSDPPRQPCCSGRSRQGWRRDRHGGRRTDRAVRTHGRRPVIGPAPIPGRLSATVVAG